MDDHKRTKILNIRGTLIFSGNKQNYLKMNIYCISSAQFPYLHAHVHFILRVPSYTQNNGGCVDAH